MADFDFDMRGLDGLQKALNELVVETQDKITRRAIRKAAVPIAEQAARDIPIDEGDLLESLKIEQSRGLGSGDDAVKIGHTSKGFYAHLIEFGTVNAAPQPYLTPAADDNKQQVVNIIGAEIGKGVERAVKKARSK